MKFAPCILLAAALLAGCGDAGSGGGTTDSGGTTDASSSGEPTGGPGSSTGPAVTCTSKKYWTMGDEDSPLMHPGRACIACHQTVVGEDVATMLAVGGTVYPSLHEEDDCDGFDGAAEPVFVEITTADDRVLQLPVNAAGNFMYDQDEDGPIMFPIRARVVRGDAVMAMGTPQMTGDCNSCHTEQGAGGAPGRILVP